jgi:phosphohistidine phosphatase
MDLYVLRHGEAGKRPAAGSKDPERSLTLTGEDEVKEIAEALVNLGLKLDFIASSPLARARQTAEIIVRKLEIKGPKFELWDELKPEGNRISLYDRLGKFKPEDSIMIVGHEPYLSDLVCDMIFDGRGKGRIVLKKAGLAKISVTSTQPRAKGELRWLLTPRHMKGMVSKGRGRRRKGRKS